MKDPRLAAYANTLVNYSTRVAPGDFVIISCGDQSCAPLVHEVYRHCLRAGAQRVKVEYGDPVLSRILFEEGSEEQLGFFPEIVMEEMRQCTVYIAISASANSRELAGCDPQKMSRRARLLRPIVDQRVNHTRWVICDYPTPSAAQEAGMSLEAYEDFVIAASTIDYDEFSRQMQPLTDLLGRTDRVRITGKTVDLSFSVKGIAAVKCDGRYNIPDGEVYTAPVRESVNGTILYTAPTTMHGKVFSGITIEFKDGKAVRASCPGMDDELAVILDTDEGARYIGEFAIGCNPMITMPALNILFDEKIAGSIHTALGSCYEDAPNGNQSALHWDLVRVFDEGDEMYFDDTLVMRGRRFVHPELVALNS